MSIRRGFDGWWERHCERSDEKERQYEEDKRNENTVTAIEVIQRDGTPQQALEAARLTVSRNSTSLAIGPKLSAEWSQRVCEALQLFENELEGKNESGIVVYAGSSNSGDSPGSENNPY
jgi:hypothetical protein